MTTLKTQTFGIEIETTGLCRERTAKALAAFFGTTAVHRAAHLDDWRVPILFSYTSSFKLISLASFFLWACSHACKVA